MFKVSQIIKKVYYTNLTRHEVSARDRPREGNPMRGRRMNDPDQIGLPGLSFLLETSKAINLSKAGPRKPIGKSRNPVSAFLNASALDVAELELRSTDIKIENAFSLLLRNDEKVYSALIRLSEESGKKFDQYIWRVKVGYSKFAPESGRSTRTLERAFPRLASLNYVIRYPEAYAGKVPATYWVRTPEGVMTMFAAVGCTHCRILRGKRIQLLKSKLPDRPAGGVKQ
jgi:hypothetical protein